MDIAMVVARASLLPDRYREFGGAVRVSYIDSRTVTFQLETSARHESRSYTAVPV
jgi:hypothetical protein